MVKLDLKNKLTDDELDLSLMDLNEIPVKEISNIPKATGIDLSCNQLTCIPNSFCSLTNIVKLDLSKNRISELPSGFGNLARLQHLDLYSNKLKHLPLSFGKLQNLKWLDLKNNPLNSDLQKVSGECINEKQCFDCAKKVVNFMRNLEAEKQKRLQQKKEADRANEEAAEHSKLEKEKRKADKPQKEKEKPKQKQSPKPTSAKEQQQKKKGKAVQNGVAMKKSKNYSTFGFFCALLFWLALAAALALGVLTYYTGGNFTKEEVQKAVVSIYDDCLLVLRFIFENAKLISIHLYNFNMDIVKIFLPTAKQIASDICEIAGHVKDNVYSIVVT